ncbi:hypothetical protein DNTS_021890, partial [Danionella cerebrum]
AALSALKQLSEQGLDQVDGPIKVENILVNLAKRMEIKVTNFTLCRSGLLPGFRGCPLRDGPLSLHPSTPDYMQDGGSVRNDKNFAFVESM